MTRNPLVNAGAASAYIAGIAAFMYYAPHIVGKEDSAFVPVAMLSLFVFSAAVMAFIFFFQPLQLLIEGNKQEAVSLFLKTLGLFGVLTVVWFCVLVVLSA